jgi:hypothetical protein
MLIVNQISIEGLIKLCERESLVLICHDGIITKVIRKWEE